MRTREALSGLGLQDATFFDVDWKERKREKKGTLKLGLVLQVFKLITREGDNQKFKARQGARLLGKGRGRGRMCMDSAHFQLQTKALWACEVFIFSAHKIGSKQYKNLKASDEITN